MKWFLYFFSIILIGGGTCFVLYTERSRNILKKMFEGVDARILSILPVAFGVLLIFSAYKSEAFLFFFILGILGIIKGLLFIFNPKKIVDSLLTWWFEKTTEQVIRLWGLLMVIVGTAVFSWI